MTQPISLHKHFEVYSYSLRQTTILLFQSHSANTLGAAVVAMETLVFSWCLLVTIVICYTNLMSDPSPSKL